MQLTRSLEINLRNLWEPEMFGVFVMCNSKVSFLFNNGQFLYVMEEDQCVPQALLSYPEGHAFPLPSDWIVKDTPNSTYLLLNESFGINLRNKSRISPLPEELLTEYKRCLISAKHYVEDDFCFDDYRISHMGMSGYSCTKQGKRMWTFQGRAYLYTEIERYQDRVFFGTAGNGGNFYILDLETGATIANIKTGGTRCMEQIESRCYFLQNEKKTSMLLCVDLQSGQLLESVVLPGKASVNSRIKIIGNNLHAITFHSRDGILQKAFWNIVRLWDP